MPTICNKRKKRRTLYKRQGGLCWLCHKSMPRSDATFDHLIPRSKGGGQSWENLKLAHRSCNEARDRDMRPVFMEHEGTVALRWDVRSVP
jgi:5-methylcytosine-specific restriction endonuclease McrA